MGGTPQEDQAPIDAFRPQNLAELHAAIAAVSGSDTGGGNAPPRRRGSLPPVVSQLQAFCEQRAACQQRCVARLRDRAAFEASLVPASGAQASGSSSGGLENAAEVEQRRLVEAAVQRRFATLESQCSAVCGRRLAHLVGGGPA
eukprot:CAMPEP_0203860824 /NCGR_PEP_ID=MMETSP0359-20131031/12653_1 /ASSEMBLY_ACC=CAM_ASM_000338 /TAXON_ID=268821 /ORGANISM="Scrippsiella Hangoei, Strain SHTV-5" /LENGTH=143 /DNA_ID=CAMNT_0050777963 /DNA_START=86 /DNA_END=517 /DNA_ORIENTATION=+